MKSTKKTKPKKIAANQKKVPEKMAKEKETKNNPDSLVSIV